MIGPAVGGERRCRDLFDFSHVKWIRPIKDRMRFANEDVILGSLRDRSHFVIL